MAFFLNPAQSASLVPGDLIRTPESPSLYYYGADFKRYVFPNEFTYQTWYPDFKGVKRISGEEMGALPIGGNVTYKPASRLVKAGTDPTVYAISKNGILRAIASEGIAAELYGPDWNRRIDSLPDAFFVNYRVGAPLLRASEFDRAALTKGVPSINVDKRLVDTPHGFIDVRADGGFTPREVTVRAGESVTWIAVDASSPTLASNPHPTHTDDPAFLETTLPMGATWTYTFFHPGTYGYHNHNFPDVQGEISVQ